MTLFFPVDDPSRVAEVRRAGERIAHEEELDGESAIPKVSLVITEICTNLLKHAGGGEVFLSALSPRSGPGLEILAVDRGPGISDLQRSFTDGYSSTDTAGTGLGAITRLSTEFDVYSQPGKGTVLVARIQPSHSSPTTVGAVLKPMRGEDVSGDAWALARPAGALALIVADGLGHGVMAAQASAEAIASFRRSDDYTPTTVLSKVHLSVRSTRGAAVAVAYVDSSKAKARYAGIGNISGVLIGGVKPVQMVSHNGTAGYHSPRLQEFEYPLPSPATIIMHSDGLQTSWSLDEYPGLRRRDPSLIAGVLYRDAARNRDDVCVVVAKIGDSM
jgi:anti-sigma regulatory factor (Ser/Thr protein kinase)